MTDRDPSDGDVLYEVSDGTARLTLNRPEKRNAISFAMQRRLHDALWEADNDTRLHAIVLRGAGPAFCAGYDLLAPPTDQMGEGKRRTRAIDDDSWHLEYAVGDGVKGRRNGDHAVTSEADAPRRAQERQQRVRPTGSAPVRGQASPAGRP